MELLKVFVGNPTSSGATTIEGMVKGDLLLLNASDYKIYSGGDAVIAGCNENGVYYSTPIKKANIRWSGFKATASYTPKQVTFSLAEGTYGSTSASSTYSLGIQIKEDLRMGTYNKNTEVIASHTTPSTAGSTVAEVASTLAKGFSANPLTSAGSPYQLVKVVRTSTATAITSLSATVATGSRQVTFGASHGLAVGDFVSLDGAIYQVESIPTINGSVSTTIAVLDTAYQGTLTSLAGDTTAAAGKSGKYTTGATPANIKFVFTAITQTQKNRYDQFRVVEFDVIAPKGWTNVSSIAVVNTATALPVGSYRQVRDLEEKAYTNSHPLINYREFPFETFPINANPTLDTYAIFTVVYDAGWGYNMMQKSNSIFPQTVVVCAPVTIDGQFDATAAGTSFAESWATFATATLLDGSTFPNPTAP